PARRCRAPHHPPILRGAGAQDGRFRKAELAYASARLAPEAGMKPAAFDYIRAETLAEVHAALAAEGGRARVIAGGQTLLPMLSMRRARPHVEGRITALPQAGANSLVAHYIP